MIKLGLFIDILQDMYRHVTICRKKAKEAYNYMIANIAEKINELRKSANREKKKNEDDGAYIEHVADCLIAIRNIHDNLSISKKLNTSEILLDCVNKFSEMYNIRALANQLERDKKGIGMRIINSVKSFSGVSNMMFKQKTKSRGIQVILKELKGDKVNVKSLSTAYDKYLCSYDNSKLEYCKIPINLQGLINEIEEEVFRLNKHNTNWNKRIAKAVPSLLGKICALMDFK